MSQQSKKELLRNFSETLRAIRMRRGWTQGELAGKLDVSPGAVANWEAMINGPTRSRVKDISDRLNVSIDFLTRGPDGAILSRASTPEQQLPLRQEIIEYLEAFMHKCGDDPRRLSWMLVELQTHFPLSKWEPSTHVAKHAKGSASYKEVASAAEASMDDAAAAAGIRGRGRKP